MPPPCKEVFIYCPYCGKMDWKLSSMTFSIHHIAATIECKNCKNRFRIHAKNPHIFNDPEPYHNCDVTIDVDLFKRWGDKD